MTATSHHYLTPLQQIQYHANQSQSISTPKSQQILLFRKLNPQVLIHTRCQFLFCLKKFSSATLPGNGLIRRGKKIKKPIDSHGGGRSACGDDEQMKRLRNNVN